MSSTPWKECKHTENANSSDHLKDYLNQKLKMSAHWLDFPLLQTQIKNQLILSQQWYILSHMTY
jgi:hypothetical protein